MSNRSSKKTALLILAALMILLCFSVFGCKNTAHSSTDLASSARELVSSSAMASAKPSSASQPVSAASSKVNDSASSSVSQGSKNSSTSSIEQEKVSQAPVTSSAQYSKHVTLTIDATKGNDGVVASAKQVGINAGDTVYAVLKRYCSNNKILIAAQKTGNGMYVSSIDGIAQFDCGSQSGWIFSVGGAFAQKDCNSYKLSGGENIKWVYTIDLGKSEEKSK